MERKCWLLEANYRGAFCERKGLKQVRWCLQIARMFYLVAAPMVWLRRRICCRSALLLPGLCRNNSDAMNKNVKKMLKRTKHHGKVCTERGGRGEMWVLPWAAGSPTGRAVFKVPVSLFLVFCGSRPLDDRRTCFQMRSVILPLIILQPPLVRLLRLSIALNRQPR